MYTDIYRYIYLWSKSLYSWILQYSIYLHPDASQIRTREHTFTIQIILGPTYLSVSDRVIHRLCTLTTQNLAKCLISVCLSIYQAKAAVAAAEVALEATVEANIAAAAAAEISAEVIRLRCVTNTEKEWGEWESDALVYKRKDSAKDWEKDHEHARECARERTKIARVWTNFCI